MGEDSRMDLPDETREMRKIRLSSIGPYPIEAIIGKGGMGVVYRCFDPQLRRTVAIKVLSEERVRDAESRERFIGEAQAIARLSHPNVVQIYAIDPGADGRPPYFVMEFVAGPSGEDRLRNGPPFTPEGAARAILDVARGLREAHRRGLIHRDIKPSNILFDEAGVAKIADFGLVKDVRPEADRSDDGVILGTPHYISPEQGQGKAVDHRSDIYSLGATFYHLLTGSPPFEEPSQVSAIVAHVTAPLVPVREKNPAVPAELAAIVERMLQKDPAARYPTYEELIADLEGFLEGSARGPRTLIGAALGVAAILAGALLAYGATRILSPDPFGAFPSGTIADAPGGGKIIRNEFRNGLREIEAFWRVPPAGDVVARDDGRGRLIIEGRSLADGDGPSASIVGLPVRALRRLELRGLELEPGSHFALAFGRHEPPSRTFSIRLRDGVPNGSGDIAAVERNGERHLLHPEGGTSRFAMASEEAYDIIVDLSTAAPGAAILRVEILRRIRGREPARELEASYALPPLAGDDWRDGEPRILLDRVAPPFGLALDDVILVAEPALERWRAQRARGA